MTLVNIKDVEDVLLEDFCAEYCKKFKNDFHCFNYGCIVRKLLSVCEESKNKNLKETN